MKTFAPCLLLLLALAGPVLAQSGPRDLTDAEYARTLELFMTEGRAASAAFLEALADSCAGRPLYVLARARVRLETLPLDDDAKDVTGELSAPALAELDDLIAWADAGLDRDEDDLRLRYYRGWAWMMKSQFKAFGRDFYGAGRDAGKGKNDIEAYLAVHPDEPIPNGLLGAYLYFTDAVPKLFQFLSKLLFLPTGDRDRGLAMIRQAIDGDSPARVDYEVLNANVTFFFEGHFEDGLDLANDLLSRYPRYPRVALPSAVVAPFDPFRATAHLERVQDVLTELESASGIDVASLEAVRAFQGWSLRILAGHESARTVLEPLAERPPVHPDWAGDFARLQLAHMAALEGRTDEARRLAIAIRADETNTRFHDQAARLLSDLRDRPPTVDPVADRDVARLYAEGPDATGEVFAAQADRSLRAAFHAADARLLGGDERGALRLFREVHAREAAAWEEPYRMLAAARIGEISAAAGNWRGGANWMGRAAEQHLDVYRLDWLLQGRERFFRELGEGATDAAGPSLLAPAP